MLVRTLALFVTLMLAASETASAQPATGFPPFGSFSGSSGDTVDNANLNIHMSIPVFGRAGRAVPFSFTLGFDSAVWSPTSASGTSAWTPNGNWGWSGMTQAQTGLVTYKTVGTSCTTNGTTWYYWNIFENFAYIDAAGTTHSFGFTTSSWQPGTPCGQEPYGNASGTANDGSGYNLSVIVTLGQNGIVNSGTVLGPDGTTYYPPLLQGTGWGQVVDSNGNYVTASTNGTTTTFTDTLGTTALLAIAGGVGNPQWSLQYVGPNGSNAQVMVHYGTYTVQTTFGCSGVAEYGPTLVYLVNQITMLSDGTSYYFTYEPTIGYPGNVTGRIASIQLPSGGTINYSYSGGSLNRGIVCRDGSTATLTRTTPDGTWTYAHLETDANTWSTTITDPSPQQNQTVVSFQNTYEVQRKVYNGSSITGTLMETVDTCYNGSASPCTGIGVYPPIAQTSRITTLPGSSSRVAKTTATFNSLGLPLVVDEYDYGTGGPGSLLRETATVYASLGNGIQNRPASVTVKNSIGQTAAQTTYAYDEYATQSSGSPQLFGVTGSRGNVTTITQSTGSTPLTQHLHYFDNGNVYTATDVNNAVTTYTYGACGNSLLTQTALPVSSLTTQAMWNCTGGVQTSVTDANNKTTTTYYNDSQNTWRPTSATDPTGATTSLTYYTSGTPKGSEGALIFNSSASTVDTRTSLDALGRIRVSQTKWSPSSPNYDSTETDYDPAGRPSRVTVPYQATVGVTNSNAPATKTTYDALNRPATVTDGGGGTVSYAYDRNDVLVTLGPRDSIGFKQRQLEYDALGRLTSVCEMTTASGSGYGTCGQTVSQSGYWTKYTYDALGNVLTVTQNAQTGGSPQTRGYTYDQLGRMLSETNPESGTYHYAYDTDSTCGTYNGDLVKRTDAVLPPNATVTCYAYDALHRVTAISYPNGYYASATQVKHFVYDQSAALNSLGRLGHAYTCSASTGDCSNWLTDLGFVYSARGEVTDVYQKSPNSGGYYHASAGYWPTGPQGLINTLSLNLSGVPTWTYNPDGEGRILSVSASSGQSPVTSASYNLFSLPTNVTLGSGDADTFGYDGNTGRMTSYNAALGVSPWVTLAVSGPQSGTSYYDTDSFTVTVHGAASAQVAVGTTTCTGAYPMGQTNGNGDWFLPGRWTAGNVGTYTQLWCVNGVAATPTLNFSVVSSTPTPAGPTSSLLGPSTSGTLTWNQNGTLAEVAAMDGFNAGNSQACAYTHDDLGRLGQIDCGTNNGSLKWGQNFSYDSLGNIKWLPMDGHSGTRFQFGYDPNTNHFVGQSYDANGNLLADGAHTYTWDAEGNMISVSDTSTTTVIYDALGRRVEQNGGSASAELLYGPDGSKLAVMSGQTVIKALVPLPGGATAVYNSSGLAWYRHPDWLGSSRIASTPTTRTMYYDGAYSPFGETMAEAGTADRNFTGQNQDVRPDLYDFMYRDYHPSHGRWISPDPAGMGSVNAADPQTWNRYGYVRNSPLANIDPDGQDCVPCFVFIAPTNPVGAIIGGLISLGLDLWSFFGGGGGPPAGPPQPAAPPAMSGNKFLHISRNYDSLSANDEPNGGGGGGLPLAWCDPNFLARARSTFKDSELRNMRPQTVGTEEGFVHDPNNPNTPTVFRISPAGKDAGVDITIDKNTTLFFHTHPFSLLRPLPWNGYPTPVADAGRYLFGHYVYSVIGTGRGLFVSIPGNAKNFQQVANGLDWLNKNPCK